MGQLTQAIGAFIAGMDYAQIPAPAIGAVKNALSDYAAVTILGRDEPVTRMVASFERVGAEGDSRVLFSAQRAQARAAALINGTAGHAHDYDDVGIGFHPAHPSVAIAPALFAYGETIGASGRDIIAAYVAAYEVWSELASRDKHPQHVKGWHPTGAFGTIAAAAGVAKLMKLDADACARAVSIAASQAAGLVTNFGTMTKPFHAGRAASAGLMSALYAQAGMTATPDMFDNAKGFLHAVSPHGEVDYDRPANFGKDWRIVTHGVSVKLYPMCYGAHRILSTLPGWAKAQGLRPDDIHSVVFRTGPSRVVPLVHTSPQRALDAKFSAEFAIAMALIAGRATMVELTDAFVSRPDVRGLMSRVTRELDPARDGASFTDEPDDDLLFTMNDGTQRVLKLEAPRDQAISLDPETLWIKFLDCTRTAMRESDARALFDALQSLDRLDTLNALPLPQQDRAAAE